MTGCTGPCYRVMVHKRKRLPVGIGMALITNMVCLNMTWRHLVCRHQAALVVTSRTGNRRPLKQAFQVTTGTDCLLMSAFKWKSCRKVIEPGIAFKPTGIMHL